MLRFSFLPSDFHPVLLMLGEAEDLGRLATLLRRFALDGAQAALERQPFAAPSDTRVVITAAGDRPGLRAQVEAEKSFQWTLDRDTALRFAQLLDGLGDPSRKAGSEILDTGAPEETLVKVSLGEFTDDFLLPGNVPGRARS